MRFRVVSRKVGEKVMNGNAKEKVESCKWQASLITRTILSKKKRVSVIREDTDIGNCLCGGWALECSSWGDTHAGIRICWRICMVGNSQAWQQVYFSA